MCYCIDVTVVFTDGMPVSSSAASCSSYMFSFTTVTGQAAWFTT